jgi:peroxiredoxin
VNRASSPQAGDPAPALALPTLEGTSFDLEDLRGRPVLVSFLRHAG